MNFTDMTKKELKTYLKDMYDVDVSLRARKSTMLELIELHSAVDTQDDNTGTWVALSLFLMGMSTIALIIYVG